MQHAGFLGLKPNEVYAMTYCDFYQWVLGHNKRQKLESDGQIRLELMGAFYSGYYSGQRKYYKSLQEVVDTIIKPEDTIKYNREEANEIIKCIRDNTNVFDEWQAKRKKNKRKGG